MELLLIYSIYSITLIIFLLNFFIKIDKKIIFVFLFFCFIFSALRSNSFPDYSEYVSIYDGICRANSINVIFDNSLHGEIGFKLINYLTCNANSALPLFMLMSLFSFLLYTLICSRFEINPLIAWVIYFPYAFLLKDMAQIRNAVASLLIVYALLNLHKLRSIFIILLSSLFFQTYALCAIPFIKSFLSRRKKRFYILATVILLMMPSLAFTDLHVLGIGTHDVARYEQTEYIHGNSDIQKFKSAIIFVVLMFFSFKWYYIDNRVRSLMVGYFGGFFYYVIFNNIPIISQRLGGYLTAVEPFVISLLYAHIMSMGNRKDELLIKITYSIFVMLLSVVYFYTNMTTREFLMNLKM